MIRFRLFNAVLFIALGSAIAWQIVRVAGPRIEALPGLALGAAMIGLGAYRLSRFARSQ